MKKAFLFLAVVGMLGLASCNKEEFCDCTSTAAGITSSYEQLKERTDCSDYNQTTTQSGIVTQINCEEQD